MALQARGPKHEPVRTVDGQKRAHGHGSCSIGGCLHPLGPWQTTWAANTEQAGLSGTKLRGGRLSDVVIDVLSPSLLQDRLDHSPWIIYCMPYLP